METPSFFTIIIALLVFSGLIGALLSYTALVSMAYGKDITSDYSFNSTFNLLNASVVQLDAAMNSFSVSYTNSPLDYLIGTIMFGYNLVTGIFGLLSTAFSVAIDMIFLPLAFLNLGYLITIIKTIFTISLIAIATYVLLGRKP